MSLDDEFAKFQADLAGVTGGATGTDTAATEVKRVAPQINKAPIPSPMPMVPGNVVAPTPQVVAPMPVGVRPGVPQGHVPPAQVPPAHMPYQAPYPAAAYPHHTAPTPAVVAPVAAPPTAPVTDPTQVVASHEVRAAAAAQANAERARKDAKAGKPHAKKFVRSAAGETWEDPTLAEWDPNDFRVFCGNLGNEVTDDILKAAFNKYSSFAKAKVLRDKKTGATRGYGFVSFRDANDYMDALRTMNGKYIGNRPVLLRKSVWEKRGLSFQRKQERKKKQMFGAGGNKGSKKKKNNLW